MPASSLQEELDAIRAVGGGGEEEFSTEDLMKALMPDGPVEQPIDTWRSTGCATTSGRRASRRSTSWSQRPAGNWWLCRNIGEKAGRDRRKVLEKEGLSLETEDLSDLGEEAG